MHWNVANLYLFVLSIWIPSLVNISISMETHIVLANLKRYTHIYNASSLFIATNIFCPHAQELARCPTLNLPLL